MLDVQVGQAPLQVFYVTVARKQSLLFGSLGYTKLYQILNHELVIAVVLLLSFILYTHTHTQNLCVSVLK